MEKATKQKNCNLLVKIDLNQRDHKFYNNVLEPQFADAGTFAIVALMRAARYLGCEIKIMNNTLLKIVKFQYN